VVFDSGLVGPRGAATLRRTRSETGGGQTTNINNVISRCGPRLFKQFGRGVFKATIGDLDTVDRGSGGRVLQPVAWTARLFETQTIRYAVKDRSALGPRCRRRGPSAFERKTKETFQKLQDCALPPDAQASEGQPRAPTGPARPSGWSCISLRERPSETSASV
jgi:hypothetical protein